MHWLSDDKIHTSLNVVKLLFGSQPSDMLDQTVDSVANINAGRAVSAVSAEQQRAVRSIPGTTLEVSLLVAFLFYAVMLLLKCTAHVLSWLMSLLCACQSVVIAEGLYGLSKHHSIPQV